MLSLGRDSRRRGGNGPGDGGCWILPRDRGKEAQSFCVCVGGAAALTRQSQGAMGGVPIWSGSGSVEGVGVAVIVRRADGRSSSLSSCAGSLVAGTSRPPELQDAYKSAGRLEGRLKFLGFQSSRRLPSTVPFSPSPVEIHRRLWSVAGGDTKLPPPPLETTHNHMYHPNCASHLPRSGIPMENQPAGMPPAFLTAATCEGGAVSVAGPLVPKNQA